MCSHLPRTYKLLGAFSSGGKNAERQQCQEPRQGHELYTLEMYVILSPDISCSKFIFFFFHICMKGVTRVKCN